MHETHVKFYAYMAFILPKYILFLIKAGLNLFIFRSAEVSENNSKIFKSLSFELLMASKVM